MSKSCSKTLGIQISQLRKPRRKSLDTKMIRDAVRDAFQSIQNYFSDFSVIGIIENTKKIQRHGPAIVLEWDEHVDPSEFDSQMSPFFHPERLTTYTDPRSSLQDEVVSIIMHLIQKSKVVILTSKGKEWDIFLRHALNPFYESVIDKDLFIQNELSAKFPPYTFIKA